MSFPSNFNSHAHVERDCYDKKKVPYATNFNSHAHVERDEFVPMQGDICVFISTHTLTWSVTTYFTALALYYTNFNSHAHVERDFLCVTVFQQVRHFNSHAHVERDASATWLANTVSKISTHTLTWSVTKRKYRAIKLHRFQLTRSRGA